jgi:hypothetical protein
LACRRLPLRAPTLHRIDRTTVARQPDRPPRKGITRIC